MATPRLYSCINPYESSPGTTGLLYVLECTIPGMKSGGAHWCAVVSSDAYAQQTGHAVVAPLRRWAPADCAVRTSLHDVEALSLDRLDQTRYLDLGQLHSVSISALTSPRGIVRDAVLARIEERVPSLFQFLGPWHRRGQVISVSDAHGIRQIALIQQDAILSQGRQYFVGLNYRTGNAGWMVETVNAQSIR